MYERHAVRVRTMAKRLGITLVEVNIEAPDAGEVLHTQMGGKASCWKQTNANKGNPHVGA